MNPPGGSVENGFQEDRTEFWATAKRLFALKNTKPGLCRLGWKRGGNLRNV